MFNLVIHKRNYRSDFTTRANKHPEYDLSKFDKNLLPNIDYEEGELQLSGLHTGYALAFRNIPMCYLPRKILDVDLVGIQSTDPYLEPYQVQHCLNNIPVKQSIPENAKFSVQFRAFSSSGSKNLSPISVDCVKIRDMESVLDYKEHLYQDFVITNLFFGHDLKIKDIRVKSGYGYENGKFALVRDLVYEIVDYLVVRELNSVGHLQMKTVFWRDLVAGLLLPDTQFNVDKPSGNDPEVIREWALLHLNRIIVVPDKSGIEKMILPVGILALAPAVIYTKMTYYANTQYNPQDFRIKYKTMGFDLLDTISATKNYIIDHINSIKTGIETYNPDEQTKFNISEESGVYKIMLRGETDVMGNLLIYTICDLYRDIKFASFDREYSGNMTIILNIKHPDYKAVVVRACDTILKTLATFVFPEPGKV